MSDKTPISALATSSPTELSILGICGHDVNLRPQCRNENPPKAEADGGCKATTNYVAL